MELRSFTINYMEKLYIFLGLRLNLEPSLMTDRKINRIQKAK